MGTAKDPSRVAELNSVMVHLAESLRITAILLQPVMTETPKEILRQLGVGEDSLSMLDIRFGDYPKDAKVISKGQPIFPRLDMEEEVAYIKEQMAQSATPKEEEEWNPEETELVSSKEKEIKYEDFDKVELKVAEVIACSKVKGADKLLQFRLDAGDKGHRQILSGIAEFYPDPTDLVGKK